MVNYICENCEYTTTLKGDFTRHINKKLACVNKSKPVIIAPNVIAVETNDFILNEILAMKQEIETLKTKNIFLETELNKLKSENILKTHFDSSFNELKFFLKDEVCNLKIDMANQKLHQAPAQPQFIQIPQPLPLEQPKEPNRKDKSVIIKKDREDCILLNELVDKMDYKPEDMSLIINAKGTSHKVKFINGMASLFLRKLSVVEDENKPIFCSDKCSKKIQFKHCNKTAKRMKVGYSYDKLYEKFKSKIHSGEMDVDELETDEFGEYQIEEVVCSDGAIEWKSEGKGSYDSIAFYLNKMKSKLFVSQFNKYVSERDYKQGSEEWADCYKIVCNESVEENIDEIIAIICNGIYVE